VTSVVFYFQAHQPYRLGRYTFFDIGRKDGYFDDAENERIVRRVAERCYLPANRILLEAIERTEGRFRCAFSLSGTLLSQLEAWVPDALESFQALAATGHVEFLCETSHHSLAFLEDLDEWEAQIEDQRARIETLFGRAPTTFRNTELIFDEKLAQRLERMGFDVLLGEGADRLLDGRSAHHAWRPRGCERLKLFLRDYERSDDIAFRFSNQGWDRFPLMADTFASWLHQTPEEDELVGLFMDYETFGEHQWADTGILDFLEFLPEFVLQDERFDFQTPAAVAERVEPAGELTIPDPVSWADAERDLSAWLGNHMQRAAHQALFALLPDVRRADAATVETWRKLATSDHVYYMSTRRLADSDQDVHDYFSPYATPHDAFITFMNVVDDLARRLARRSTRGSVS